MFPCFFLHSSHPLLPPLCPHVCFLCLHCCHVNRFISTIFLDSIYMCQYTIFVFLFLTWLHSVINSRFIHLIRTDSNAFLSMAEWYSVICTYHNFFIHSSVNGHLGCFHVLAIINSVAMNTGIHVYFSIMVFSGYMPSSGIVGSYCSFIPSF